MISTMNINIRKIGIGAFIVLIAAAIVSLGIVGSLSGVLGYLGAKLILFLR